MAGTKCDRMSCAGGVIEKGLDRISVAVGMVPRGEVGLIFADIGRRAGILSPETFSAILIMVIVTTFIALLELVRLGVVHAMQKRVFGQISIELKAEEEH